MTILVFGSSTSELPIVVQVVVDEKPRADAQAAIECNDRYSDEDDDGSPVRVSEK